MLHEKMVCEMRDFIVGKGLEEEFIDFVAKADREDYKEVLKGF